MSNGPEAEPRFIWATRGRDWGFRFLRRGGVDRPLQVYEEIFDAARHELDQHRLWHRVGDRAALRFPDPEGRRDAAGRVIVHDFVLFDELVTSCTSADDGEAMIWALVADEFAEIWDQPPPPRNHSN